MEKIVLYIDEADVFSAIELSQKLQCPVMSKFDYERSGLVADEIIQIGSKEKFQIFEN